jgi:hypothetical protein
MSTPRSRKADLILIAIFAAILLAPGLCQIAGIDIRGTAEDEKRVPRPFPKLAASAKALREFPRGFDAWFTDHFGLRLLLIRSHGALLYFGLKSSPAPKVIVGRDGWLYYNSKPGNDGTDSVADFRGHPPLTPARLEQWRWLLQDEHDWCAAQGIKFMAAFVPAKEVVYPEHLPGWMRRTDRPMAIEQVAAHLQGRARFSWMDLTPAVRAGMARDRVYLLTDSHWSRYGAYCGYRRIMEQVSSWFPSTEPPPDSAFVLSHERYISGDLTQLMSLRPLIDEDYVLMKPVRPVRGSPHPVSTRDLADVLSEIADTNLPTAVVFRDSFTEDLVPFLSEHFRRVVYSWSRTGVDLRVVQREKPDVVLHIAADRAFRVDIRYPTDVREFCASNRFAAATNVLLVAREPKPVRDCSIAATDGSAFTIEASGNLPRVELGSLGSAPASWLPVLRLDIEPPARTDAHLVFRNAAGRETDLRLELPRGRSIVHLPLVDPELAGPLLFEPGRRPGRYVIHGLEVRGIPR